jgi:hypothetical protein
MHILTRTRYHLAREQKCRDMADRAANPRLAGLHDEMADYHARLANMEIVDPPTRGNR